MLFCKQDKLFSFILRECRKCGALCGINPSGGAAAKIRPLRSKGNQFFFLAVWGGLRFRKTFCGKLLYAGINRLFA